MPQIPSPFRPPLPLFESWAKDRRLRKSEISVCKQKLLGVGAGQLKSRTQWLLNAFDAIDTLRQPRDEFHESLDLFLGSSALAPLTYEDLVELGNAYHQSPRSHAYQSLGAVGLGQWLAMFMPTRSCPMNLGAVALLHSVAQNSSYHCPQVNNMLSYIYSTSRSDMSLFFTVASLLPSDAASAEHLKDSTISPSRSIRPNATLNEIVDASRAEMALEKLMTRKAMDAASLSKLLSLSDSLPQDTLDNAVGVLIQQLDSKTLQTPELYTFFDTLVMRNNTRLSPTLRDLYSNQLSRINYLLDHHSPMENPIDPQDFSAVAWRYAWVIQYGLINTPLARHWITDLCSITHHPSYCEDINQAIADILYSPSLGSPEPYLDRLICDQVPLDELPKLRLALDLMIHRGHYPNSSLRFGLCMSRRRDHESAVNFLEHALKNPKSGQEEPLDPETRADAHAALGYNYQFSHHPQSRALAKKHLREAIALGLFRPVQTLFSLYIEDDEHLKAARLADSLEFWMLMDKQHTFRHSAERFFDLQQLHNEITRQLSSTEEGRCALLAMSVIGKSRKLTSLRPANDEAGT